MVRFIAAVDSKLGIADDHGIPWQGKIPGDVAYYREKINDGGLLLMGYGLYKELTHPYPGGTNYVATGNKDEKLMDGFEPVSDAVEFIKSHNEDIWNLGGAMLFSSTLDYADELYITQLQADFNCTKFFPSFKDEFELVSSGPEQEENGIKYNFQVWKRKKAFA